METIYLAFEAKKQVAQVASSEVLESLSEGESSVIRRWISTAQEMIGLYIEIVGLLTDGTEEPQCTECGEIIGHDDDFCRGCGAKLSDEQFKDSKSAAIDEEKLDNKFERFDKYRYEFNEVGLEVTAAMAYNAGRNITAPWDHCPNCGKGRTVLENDKGEVLCLFCNARWEKRRKKWAMHRGELEGEKKSKGEWDEICRESAAQFENLDWEQKAELVDTNIEELQRDFT
ncbi:hypothetical protein [Haloterrigena alkaliphila]|nr:hypothetical protein [Haloterrigena alkaliphila]QSX00467.2 hypothetical protein J0X25_05735 [Haloterrigena alkaliphila]